MTEINIIGLAERIPDEASAYEYLETLRWPDGPECPHCGNTDKCYFLKPRGGNTRATRTGAPTQREPASRVHCEPDGSPLSPSNVSRRFRRMVRRSGLPRVRFHDLRHTWATLALEAGVPAKVVSERLGHTGIAITLDLYTHRVDELHWDAAEAVAGLFRP